MDFAKEKIVFANVSPESKTVPTNEKSSIKRRWNLLSLSANLSTSGFFPTPHNRGSRREGIKYFVYLLPWHSSLLFPILFSELYELPNSPNTSINKHIDPPSVIQMWSLFSKSNRILRFSEKGASWTKTSPFYFTIFLFLSRIFRNYVFLLGYHRSVSHTETSK